MSKKKSEEDQKQPPSNLKIENFTRELPVQLTRDELAERADKAAQLLADRDHQDEELKAHTKHAKSVIAQIESDMRLLSSEVRTKRTYREVECERRYDYDAGVVKEVRRDTGDTLNERPMSDREKQRDLPFDGESDLDKDFDENAAE